MITCRTCLRLIFVFSVLLPAVGWTAPQYVGQQACQECHQEEHEAWQGSHHQLAMQEANVDTVLGNFQQARFSKDGVTTTFFRDGERFMVNTDGPDGDLVDYPVSYVFGVYPLQQYMINFPQGKIQVLDIAWDTRPRDEGGQRWFSLHPDEHIPAGDVLHWTGPNMNWNYMCADCHSTDLQKNYDAASGEYHTRWSDISVACEACHGPGSAHLEWAESATPGGEYKAEDMGLTAVLNDRDGVQWLLDEETGQPRRSRENVSRSEIEVCARCHSRRSQLSDAFVPGEAFMNAYHPSLLSEGLYHVDGQMLDEVYVWGSFRQSKMYAAGVTCSDCHDPHTTELRLPGEQVCYQCHRVDQYARREHHLHAPGGEGSSCVECHMPPTTYMGVDARHEHAFRVPRPDITLSQGSPNACNNCHGDRDAEWAVQAIKEAYGRWPRGSQQYAGALNAARRGTMNAGPLLQALAMDTEQAGIARATAYAHLGGAPDQTTLMLVQQGLNDPDPLVRQGALDALEGLPLQYRLVALPAVWDEVRSVRVQAARLVAAYPREQIGAERGEKIDQVLQEYIQAQEFNAERPEAQLNLAGLYAEIQRYTESEHAFRRALDLQPQYVPAYVNFAQMLSERKRETEAANLLESGLAEVPESADLYHALGLSRVRQKNIPAAINALARAAELAPENRRYSFVYAVALQSTGKPAEAVSVLQQAAEAFPNDPEILMALVNYSREAGQASTALRYAEQLQAMFPGNPEIEALLRSLQP